MKTIDEAVKLYRDYDIGIKRAIEWAMEIECPCMGIIEGQIDGCCDCPYVEEGQA